MERAPGYMRWDIQNAVIRRTPAVTAGIRRTSAEIRRDTAYIGGFAPGYGVPRKNRRDTAYFGGKSPGYGVLRDTEHTGGAAYPGSKAVSVHLSCFAARRHFLRFWRRTKKRMPSCRPCKEGAADHPWTHACAGVCGVGKKRLSSPSFFSFLAITPQLTPLELKRCCWIGAGGHGRPSASPMQSTGW